jgi:hypothetical protein
MLSLCNGWDVVRTNAGDRAPLATAEPLPDMSSDALCRTMP